MVNLEVAITRSLGLDVGDKRIGVAISDPSGILASPLTIISYEDDIEAIEAIVDIIVREQVGQIVAGLPRSMNGALGEQANKVKSFAQKLCSHTSAPLVFRDERLTTVSANRMIRANSNKKNRKKIRDDAVAAAIILQTYLDEHIDSDI